MPEVSVVMGVYNGEAHLRQAVESILQQTFTDFEFIIVDDGSTDRTPEILAGFDDPRLVLLHSQQNLKLSGALNRGLSVARGDFIARMDADDIAYPQRLEKQLDCMRDSDIGVLGTWMTRITQDGTPLGLMQTATGHNLMAWHLLFATTVFHPSVMLRADLLDGCGGYNEDYDYAQDAELWSRLLGHTRFAALPEPLLWHRAPGEDAARTPIKRERAKQARRVFLTRLLEREVTPEEVSWLYASTVPLGPRKNLLTQAQAEHVTALILEAFNAMAAKSVFQAPVDASLRADLSRRLLDAGRSTAEYAALIPTDDTDALTRIHWKSQLPAPWWKVAYLLAHPRRGLAYLLGGGR